MAGRIAAAAGLPARPQHLTGPTFDLVVEEFPVNFTGRQSRATGVNGSVPGPILRWREGDTVTLNVTNRLREDTSIHWHGIRVPSDMDGVPGLSYRGIRPGETFTYRFPVKQSGTYWYHSHSLMQEQVGQYGSIIIDPLRPDPAPYDREHVVLLSDWTDQDPAEVMTNLKFQDDYYNFHQRTVGTFFKDVSRHGLGATIANRLMWGQMRMSPTDIADVTGATYTYLMNGMPPAANWTALFHPGERVRLRFINGSSMTFFDIRIPGLTMTVVAADGNDVAPVPVDEFRIGVAETYDVIVQPTADRAYTIFAQSEDRSGYARGTLATRPGMTAAVPPMDPRPMRNMVDMGMSMKGMSMGRMEMNGGAMSDRGAGKPMTMPGGHGGMHHMAGTDMQGTNMQGMDMDDGGSMRMSGGSMSRMSGMTMGSPPENPRAMMRDGAGKLPVTIPGGWNPKAEADAPGVDNIAGMSTERLNQPGDGLDHNGRRVLVYTDLRALRPGTDPRPPTHEILLHLTGSMSRYIWGFNGIKYSDSDPILLKLGERVRFVLINDTMMEHPIHLHGLWSELENGHGEYRPYKHTVIVKPGERLSYLVSADTPGRWAYHCHLMYHMEGGMFREVRVA